MKKFNLFKTEGNNSAELVLADASIEKVMAYVNLAKADEDLVRVEEVAPGVRVDEHDVVRFQAFDAEPAFDVSLVKKEDEI